ncbi:hypothetical protein [Dyadobacter sandarakinus]|nr:hypothetical protein [Dyadobacter sandarakinus]
MLTTLQLSKRSFLMRQMSREVRVMETKNGVWKLGYVNSRNI